MEVRHESVFHKKRGQPFRINPFLNKSGAGGDRTRDLLNAIQARSQLRHSPNFYLNLSISWKGLDLNGFPAPVKSNQSTDSSFSPLALI